MHIVATADLHGHLPHPDDLPESDVFVIAGDVCPVYDHGHVFQRSWLETNFSEWLRELPTKVVLGIGGNHDFALERSKDFASTLPWTYLLDEGIEIDGVKFWGTPWVPNLSRWAFHLDDAGLDRKVDAVPEGIDFVIMHGPPRGYCDLTVPKFGGLHAGFPGTRGMMRRVRPAAVICGHIHEGYGAMPAGDTWVFNVAHMTENYNPINAPANIAFDNGNLSTFELPLYADPESRLKTCSLPSS